jgi:hypothetical protein
VDGKQYYFWAKAVSPSMGAYPAAESSRFRPWRPSILVTAGQPHVDLPPKPDWEPAVQAHSEFVNKLVQDDWEPSGLNGEAWWQQGFQRRDRDKITTAIDLNLYDAPDRRRVLQHVPAGTTVTVVAVGDERNQWMKVRTEEGQTGYLMEDRPGTSTAAARPSAAAAATGGGCLGAIVMLVLPSVAAIALFVGSSAAWL